MNAGRWEYLSYHADDPKLTPDEVAKGWHFCPDWDYLLIGPGFPELEGCNCETKTTSNS